MNESPTQDAPTQEATGSTNEAAGEPNASPTGPSAPSAEATAAEALAAPAEPPIAPDVPRLERPAGTANAIPETILGPRPSPMFLAVVAVTSLVADVVTKLWAEKRLEGYPGYVNVLDDHLMFVLAKNKGGAWGLLQGQSENVRRPFFLLVSVAAIAFIVTLYRRLQPRQHALKWGLPLVLGGALGNVFDRIRYGFVIDFIDYRSEWIRKMNEFIAKRTPGHIVTDHWPTFNVADIAICVGVGLMAIDMLTARRGKKELAADVPLEPEPPVAEATNAEATNAEATNAEAAAATEEAAPIDASAEPTKSEG